MDSFEIQSDSSAREEPKRQKNTKCNCLIICTLLLSVFAALVLYKYCFEDAEEISGAEFLGHSFIEPLAEMESACEEDLCLTKPCVTTAARILKFMDESKSPCDDFHAYACGNYGKLLLLRAREHLYNPYIEAMDNAVIYIKRLFERAGEVTPTSSFQKARVLYEACMNDDKREGYSTKMLLEFLRNTTFRWPLFDDDEVPGGISWVQVVKEMATYGIETLFKANFVPFLNNGTTVIEVSCSITVFPPEVYLNPTEEKSEAQLNFYEDVFVLLLHTFDFKRRDARELFQKILHLETTISEALTQTEEESVECEAPCPRAYCAPCKTALSGGRILSELHVQQLKDIWSDLLGKRDSDLQVRSNCNGNLQATLTVLNTLPKKTILNYVLWRAVLHLQQFMAPKQQNIYNNYIGRLIDGQPIGMSLWRECSDLIRREMGPAIVKALTERNYLNVEHQKEVEKRFSKVKNGFKYLFYTIPWITNETIQKFSDKVDSVNLRIGLPDELREVENTDQMYDELHVDWDDSFFNNIMNLLKFKTRKRFQRLFDHDTNPLKYEYLLDRTPLDTKTSYDYEKNEIGIDYGLTFSPLMKYGPGLPEYLEHGQNIILAREISHVLDSTGIHYDSRGNRTVMDTLPLLVKQKFHNFLSCLLLRYPTITPNLVDADIADLGSLFITAAGLELQLLIEPEDEVVKQLPGVPLTRKQIYFVQSAQMFCELVDESAPHIRNRRRTAKERLNMAISNTVNFGAAFECDLDSPMNPSQKCNLLF